MVKKKRGALFRLFEGITGRYLRGHEYLIHHTSDSDGDRGGGGDPQEYHQPGEEEEEDGHNEQVDSQLKGRISEKEKARPTRIIRKFSQTWNLILREYLFRDEV